MNDLTDARRDLARSTGSGTGYLTAYGITLLAAGGLAVLVPPDQAALVVVLHSLVAAPAMFALERLLRFPPIHQANPLRSLAVSLSFMQVCLLPALIILAQRDPFVAPAAAASAGAAQLVAFGWLFRIRLYLLLAVLVAVIPWLIVRGLGDQALIAVPFAWGGLYLTFAIVLTGALRERSRPTARRLASGRAGRW